MQREPTESLYAEVLRQPGLFEQLQRDYHVIIAGPTNLAALLTSFQMGFRSLALQKRCYSACNFCKPIDTPLCYASGVLVGNVCFGISNERQGPPLTNQPPVQILAVHPANCERSAVGIRSAWGAINRSLADMLGQTITGLDTARPAFSFDLQANLIRFGSIYAFQADFRIPNDNRVPRPQFGAHQRYCWQLVPPRRQGSRVGSNTTSASLPPPIHANASWEPFDPRDAFCPNKIMPARKMASRTRRCQRKG